ncbi:RNA-directed DNA polymerase, eukaryota [Tanacetum coccineum]|uniref:RNA-directed DNA polymerase, eukaryota n=1 Tax=Tanacetum coccineum TaxID=301880 RepID=A0ABQ5CM43_9ASTR
MVAISKEEEVQKISTSIFVTNFSDHAKAKDLWNVCKQYGQVVDAFIPDRKSKAGKRYGFVRFIRVYDVDRLVSNLCTLWMGSHHLHANVARFQRPPAVNSGGYTHQNGNYVPKKTEANSNNGHRTDKRSYVNVVNGDTKSTEACEPALLLDESCLNQLDYSLGLLGKVKEFSSFDNMRMVLGNEGFDDINLRYMGGMWIMIDFKTEDTKAKFQSCLGATSWFSLLIQASKEFVIDERITWVDIEGIPLKLWSESTFNRIAAKWGKMLYLEKLDEGCLYSKRLCILTTGKSNILETFKIIHKGKRFLVRAKETMGWIPDFDEQEEDNSESEDEQSVGFIKEDFDGSDVEKEGDNNVSMVPDSVKEDVNVQAEEKGNDFDVNNSLDPFELYSLLNKKRNVEEKMDKSNETVSIPFPPGFTPCDETEVECDKKSMGNNEGSGSDNEKGESVSIGSRKSNKIEIKRTGGSLLTVMEELIKVGKTMGYNMEGCLNPKAKKDWVKEICVSHKVNFLTLQETKMEDISLIDVKCCWGNYAFEYVYSPAVGNSGGILCVWEKSAFKKNNSTISDYFVMISGSWLCSGVNLLIISVYAPQEYAEKKMLWDYLVHVISKWDGEVIVMGDFNEVRFKNERFGSLFHAHGADAFNRFILQANLQEIPLGGCSFTWCHRSAKKMSKLDRFLMSEGLLGVNPNFSALTLDRYLSDHRPIMLRDSSHDYGPIPFRMYHYWFEIDGFEEMISKAWCECPIVEVNPMLYLMYKMKFLKKCIREWNGKRQSNKCKKRAFKKDLHDLEIVIDQGNATDDILYKRMEIIKDIQEAEKSMDINSKSTSYAGAASASAKDQPKVNPTFVPWWLIPFLMVLTSLFLVNLSKRNNWAKHGLKRIMMNSKGFFFFKFDSRAGLEAVLEGGPWMICKSLIIKMKKRKGKSKSTNGGQFTGPSVKQNVRYEPKATTSAPKNAVTNVGNSSQSASMLKMTGNSSKKDNLSMVNSFSALSDEKEDDEEDVENVYDNSANLIQNKKAGGSSSLTAAVG